VQTFFGYAHIFAGMRGEVESEKELQVMRKLKIFRKFVPVALALAVVGVAAASPATARPVHHYRHHLFMYAPGFGYGPSAAQPVFSQRTGTAADRAEHPGNY